MTKGQDFLRLENQTCFPIYLCAKEISNSINSLLKPYGLTYPQFIIMMYLWEVGESNVTETADALLLDPSTVTPILKKLEIKGYVTRRRGDSDERTLHINVTKKGEELKDATSSLPGQAKDMLGLSKSEEEQLRTLTIKTLNNIKKGEKQCQ